MVDVEKEYASKGVAGAGLGTGIAGLSLGVLNAMGGLGALALGNRNPAPPMPCGAVPRRRASAGGDAERVRGGLNATGCASAHVSYLPAPIGARRAEQPGNGRRLPRSIPPGRSEQICGN